MAEKFVPGKAKKRKWTNFVLEGQLPIPIISNTDRPGGLSQSVTWQYYEGRLEGDYVLVSDKTDMRRLYSMGFFGKGTLSQGKPEYNKDMFQSWLPDKNPRVKTRSKKQQDGQPSVTSMNNKQDLLEVVSRRQYARFTEWRHKLKKHNNTSCDCIFLPEEKLPRLVSTKPIPSTIPSASSSKQDNLIVTEQSYLTTTSDAAMKTECSTSDQFSHPERSLSEDWPAVTEENDPWSTTTTEETEDFWGISKKSPSKNMVSSCEPIETTNPAKTDPWNKASSEAAEDFWGTGKSEKQKDNNVVNTDTEDIKIGEFEVCDNTKLEGEKHNLHSTLSGSSAGVLDMAMCDQFKSDMSEKTTDIQAQSLVCDNDQRNIGEVTRCDSVNTAGEMCDMSVDKAESLDQIDPVSLQSESDGSLWVVPDSEEENESSAARQTWLPVLKRNPFNFKEDLQLMLEEAFFLSYGLGCLTVRHPDKDSPLNLVELWQHCKKSQTNFVARYVAYHHYRSKGWVPHSGLKCGTDLVLYKKGPPFFHSTYSVLIRMVNEEDLKSSEDFIQTQTNMSWVRLAGLNRLTETMAKELLLCYVIRPSGITPAELESPACLPRFSIKNVVLRRWVSKHERENIEYVQMP